MEQAIKVAGITPEKVEQIKAAQKRHMAIDPGCEKLTPEEFINWHPVGGITWEERAQGMWKRWEVNSVKLLENGKIRLNSSGSLHLPTALEIPQEVSIWFAYFLAGAEKDDEYSAYEIEYKATRDGSGNVCLEQNRWGHINGISFSKAEIQIILEKLRNLNQEKETLRDTSVTVTNNVTL